MSFDPLTSGALDAWLNAAAARLEAAHRLRDLRAIRPIDAVTAEIEGRLVTLFSSNDYLGLSCHPAVRAAAAEAAAAHGMGPRAAALVCGHTEAHADLEVALARLKGTEAALLFPTGYQANLGVLQALGGDDATIFSDALNHASIIDGCRLARAGAVEIYRHRDVDDLEARLRRTTGRRVVVTDEIFSMEGTGAPLADLAALKSRHDFTLVTDAAHATLVYGPTGAGWAEACGVSAAVDFQVGTLSKAVGVHGGFVACSARGRRALLNSARTFVFTTALPLPMVAAARAALDVAADGALRAALWANVGRLAPNAPGPIVSVVLGDEARALAASHALLRAGVHVPAIRPPTVAPGTSRLRVALSAAHQPPAVLRLSALLRDAATGGRTSSGRDSVG